MANGQYKGHLLVWNAVHDEQTDTWIPDIIISWKVMAGYQFHRIKGPRLPSQEEAFALAKELARTWVDQKL